MRLLLTIKSELRRRWLSCELKRIWLSSFTIARSNVYTQRKLTYMVTYVLCIQTMHFPCIVDTLCVS